MITIKEICAEHEETHNTNEQASTNGQSTNKKIFDIRGFIAKYPDKIQVNHEKRDSDTDFFVLKTCVFNPEHTGSKEACIIQNTISGKLGYKCHHDSCKNKHWRDVRLLCEPNAYDKKTTNEKPEIQEIFYLIQTNPKEFIRKVKDNEIGHGCLLDFCETYGIIFSVERKDGSLEYHFDHKQTTFFLHKIYPHSFCFADTLEWFAYNEKSGIYEKIDDNLLADVLYLLIQKIPMKNKEGLQNLIYFGKCHVLTQREDFEKKQQMDKVCLKNCVFDIETFQKEKFNPDYFFISKINIDYNLDAKCVDIDGFLTEVLGENRKVFYEIAGYCLAPKNFLNKIHIFTGDGFNGKSITVELLNHFLGSRNVANVQLADLAIDRHYCRAMLFGKMLASYADISNAELNDMAFIKSITGEDKVFARNPYGRPFNFYYGGKLVFSANEPPLIFEDNRAVWRRIHITKFTFIVPKEKRMPNQKIMKKLTTDTELSGLLNLAIDHLKNIKKTMHFSNEMSEEDTREAYMALSDSVYQFVQENIDTDVDFNSYINSFELFQKYTTYCADNRKRVVSDKKFGAIFQKHTMAEKKKMRFGNSTINAYVGVAYKNEKLKQQQHTLGSKSNTVPVVPDVPDVSPKGSHGVSQEDFAEKSGTSGTSGTVSDLKHGETQKSEENDKKIPPKNDDSVKVADLQKAEELVTEFLGIVPTLSDLRIIVDTLKVIQRDHPTTEINMGDIEDILKTKRAETKEPPEATSE